MEFHNPSNPSFLQKSIVPLSPWKKSPVFGAILSLLTGPFGLFYVDAGTACSILGLYILGAILIPDKYSFYAHSYDYNWRFLLGFTTHILSSVLNYYLCVIKNRELDEVSFRLQACTRIKTLMESPSPLIASPHPKIEEQLFGALPDGRTARLFTLTNAIGIVIKITNYGGRIVSMVTPDRNGTFEEIGIGFDSLDKYLQTNGSHGALIGRVAGRIRDGSFILDGEEHHLWTNEDGVHIHGGKFGFGRRLWNGTIEGSRLRLDYFSPDGEEQYPGNVKVSVWYSLDGPDLRIDYEAFADKPTILNLTNHAFFNLSAFKKNIYGHDFRIQADHYLPLNEKLLPTGDITQVKNTSFDFNRFAYFYDKASESKVPIDHCFIFNNRKLPLQEWLAEARCAATGRTLSMATTEPCVQFYSGNSINVAVPGLSGTTYTSYDAFCFEAQRYPDAVNHANFPSIVLRPEETYRQTTIYRFGVDW